MDAIKLVSPTIEWKDKAINYRKEHFEYGEMIIYGSELFDKINNYEEWLESVTKNASPLTVDPNWVLTDTYFAVREKDEKIVGIIDLRHFLNDFLKDFGNCGYSVRPSERKKGYATEMLRQIIIRAKDCKMKELNLAVEKSNIPSIKTINRNGGVYERSFHYEGEEADIYKIIL
ncbi:GNAT family N-acetyltransferase [Anaerosacchariphilus polymeriproducens]|uniref:GNAT family acetyltransferase n=1 Tax=Anaerosacchariphilus polymeriproducens TaxID=1812858 RepID=A0A371AUH9_9FIRM|nr:GNAT family N-acetyltransferase [Anaerosacchariphilus polymeriproducens]RDU23199.1 GNAT family acetyltransferase [Anaerosacchariphilus polymeriproducens]